MGKAEGRGKVQKGYRCLQEIHWSQADECSFEEEIIGDDEGEVGGEEEGGVDRIDQLPTRYTTQNEFSSAVGYNQCMEYGASVGIVRGENSA